MWVTLASVVVYLAYNTAGMYVTEELGAVTRTVRGPPCREHYGTMGKYEHLDSARKQLSCGDRPPSP